MLHMSIHPVPAVPARTELLIVALRSWHDARRLALPVQQHLYRALDPLECGMLAPVFASLMRFLENAIRRPVHIGSSAGLSADEEVLIALMDDDEPPAHSRPAHLPSCPSLKWAVWSTRIMLRKVLTDAVRIHGPHPRAYA
ncbi:hypothetical protein [Sphingobium xenophagum]|uniref:hypothetical protein n=1 Tax=Sphingobium xenophagum TaxID=121428 RepID=UPI001C0E2F53|nr:hypothetical protein [Sphingobium xenophagum]QWT16582.1 hypothetical protein GTV57_20630 [Sphingobium xenophagum]